MNVTPVKVGTVVVFSNKGPDVTIGKEYTIAGVDEDGDEYFIDDAGEENFGAASGASGLGAGDGEYVVVKQGE